jgi:type IV pilus assembly protein PilC
MLLFGRLPLASLIELCRVLRHSLAAGIMLRDVFRRQATKGSAPLRPIAERIRQALEQGDSLETALEREKKAFPPLFLALASVGEGTGNLPEIFGELEKYYIQQQRFWRQVRSQSLLPILQFFAAIFIISGLIYVLSVIAEMHNAQAPDPLGIGLRGAGGALTFLLANFGFLAGIVLVYLLLSRSLEQKAIVDGLLLRLPVTGPFLMAFNLSRFALALRLTLDSGMPVGKAVALSLKGTGNAAFAVRNRVIQESLRTGDSLTRAFTRANLFPDDFLHIVAVAEEGGRVPEVMRQQAEQYAEEAERRLVVLAKVVGFGVWLAVACFLIFAIFRLAAMYLTYLNQLGA